MGEASGGLEWGRVGGEGNSAWGRRGDVKRARSCEESELLWRASHHVTAHTLAVTTTEPGRKVHLTRACETPVAMEKYWHMVRRVRGKMSEMDPASVKLTVTDAAAVSKMADAMGL